MLAAAAQISFREEHGFTTSQNTAPGSREQGEGHGRALCEERRRLPAHPQGHNTAPCVTFGVQTVKSSLPKPQDTEATLSNALILSPSCPARALRPALLSPARTGGSSPRSAQPVVALGFPRWHRRAPDTAFPGHTSPVHAAIAAFCPAESRTQTRTQTGSWLHLCRQLQVRSVRFSFIFK